MNSPVWKTQAGHDRLNDCYVQFLHKVEGPTQSILVPTRHGPSHVLVGGPEDAPPLVCLHAMRTGSAFLLSELGPVLDQSDQ